MKIEVLFPEYCNLFGDYGNMMYLKACLPEAEFIETSMKDEPYFAENDDINLIYMGPMTERAQEKVIKKLLPYKERIEELIQDNVCFLFTGNAMEVLFRTIVDGEQEISGVGIFDFTAIRDYKNRYNANFYGEINQRKIVGCKSQFSMAFGSNEDMYFAKTIRGNGINRNSIYEGIHKRNFIGTYLLGPVLVMNPYLTQSLMHHMGVEKPNLAYKDAMKEAYNQRIVEFENRKTIMEKE